MEECLNLPELLAIHKAIYEREHRRNKAIFGAQGHDIDEGIQPDGKSAEDIFNEAMGMTPEEAFFAKGGIEVSDTL